MTKSNTASVVKIPKVLTLKPQEKEAIEKFSQGQKLGLHSLRGKTFAGSKLCSFSVSKSDRILVTISSEGGQQVVVVVGVVENHDYDKAFRALNAEALEAVKYDTYSTAAPLINEAETPEAIEFAGKFFVPSVPQCEVIRDKRLPLLIMGAAGSGKTVVAKEMLLKAFLEGSGKKVHYLAPTHQLAMMMKEILLQELRSAGSPEVAEGNFPKNIIVQTFEEYSRQVLRGASADGSIPEFVGKDKFLEWYKTRPQEAVTPKTDKSRKSKSTQNPIPTIFSNPDSLYQELCIAAGCVGLNEYQQLGARQSLINEETKDKTSEVRKRAWEELEFYQRHLLECSSFNPALMPLPIRNVEQLEGEDEVGVGLVVVDECQLCPRTQLRHIIVSTGGRNSPLVALGDAAQSMLGNVPITDFVKSVFYEYEEKRIEEILWPYSYRCPSRVISLSDKIIAAKKRITGERLQGSTQGNSSLDNGLVYFLIEKGSADVDSFCEQTRQSNSTKIAVIVPNQEAKDEARKRFGIDQVFVPEEVVGLEFEQVILYGMLFESDGQPKRFVTAIDGLMKQTNETEVAKDYRFSSEQLQEINKLYVALTRSCGSVYVYEIRVNQPNILDLQDLHKSSEEEISYRQIISNLQQSTDKEWLKQIEKLIESGNLGQAKDCYERLTTHRAEESRQYEREPDQESGQIKSLPEFEVIKDAAEILGLNHSQLKSRIKTMFVSGRYDHVRAIGEYISNNYSSSVTTKAFIAIWQEIEKEHSKVTESSSGGLATTTSQAATSKSRVAIVPPLPQENLISEGDRLKMLGVSPHRKKNQRPHTKEEESALETLCALMHEHHLAESLDQKRDKFEKIKKFFEEKKFLVDVNAFAADYGTGNRLLHMSVMFGDPQLVQFLLDCGADPELTSEDGQLPIRRVMGLKDDVTKRAVGRCLIEGAMAVRSDREKLVKLSEIVAENSSCTEVRDEVERSILEIVGSMKNPNVLGEGGMAAIHLLVLLGSSKVMERVLSFEKVDPNVLSGYSKDEERRVCIGERRSYHCSSSALHLAVECGNLAVLQTLLNHRDINPNLARESDLRTPLHLAMYGNEVEISDALMSHPNVNIKAHDICRLTLDCSVSLGRYGVGVAQLLFGKGLISSMPVPNTASSAVDPRAVKAPESPNTTVQPSELGSWLRLQKEIHTKK